MSGTSSFLARPSNSQSFIGNMGEVNGNTIVWRHIREENRLVTLNPLGHRPIKDIDEIQNRNRRSTDDPYIKATMKGKHGKDRATGETE